MQEVSLSQEKEIEAEEEEEDGEVAGLRSAILFVVISLCDQPADVSSYTKNRRVVAAYLSSLSLPALSAAPFPSIAASPFLCAN